MPRVALHITTNSRKLLIGKPCILVSYFEDSGSYGIRRMLNHRGVDHQFLATRECTAEERDNEDHPYRFKLLPYVEWEKLLDDERKYTDDAEWYEELAEIRERFPQFDRVEQPTH